MGNGQWAMVNGQGMDNGQWAMGNGEWAMVNGKWAMVNLRRKNWHSKVILQVVPEIAMD